MQSQNSEISIKTKKSIGLVVIGRNSEETLKRIYTEERTKLFVRYFQEMIYVDSRSNDQSICFMKDRGFDTYLIKDSSVLSAACGRRCGTLVSNSDYILYLDSDMEFEGLEYIDEVVKEVEESDFIGAVGQVTDNYPDGSIRERKRKDGIVAVSFGGFVVIKREEVLSAGNWNHNLLANEELDLHARFSRRQKKIMFSRKIAVKHYTEVQSALQELLSIYFPIRPGRYGALGKVLRAQADIKDFFHVISLQREVLFLTIPLLSLFSFDPVFICASVFVYFYFVAKRRSYKYAFVVPGLLVGALYGCCLKSHNKDFAFEKA